MFCSLLFLFSKLFHHSKHIFPNTLSPISSQVHEVHKVYPVVVLTCKRRWKVLIQITGYLLVWHFLTVLIVYSVWFLSSYILIYAVTIGIAAVLAWNKILWFLNQQNYRAKRREAWRREKMKEDRNKLGLSWARLSSSWDLTLLLCSVDLVSLDLVA